jgi:hypothetical protein
MKWLIGICLSLFLLCPLYGQAYQNRTSDGFRDMSWGETLNEVRKTRNIEFHHHNDSYNFDVYSSNLRVDESKFLAGRPILDNTLILGFWHDQLIMVGVPFADQGNDYLIMVAALTQIYGEPEYGGDALYWNNGKSQYAIQKADQVFLVLIISTNFAEKVFEETIQRGW